MAFRICTMKYQDLYIYIHRYKSDINRITVCFLQSLLKKNDALISDLEAYNSTIESLARQAEECRVSRLSCICSLCV